MIPMQSPFRHGEIATLAEPFLPVLPALSVVEGNEVEGSLAKGSLLIDNRF